MERINLKTIDGIRISVLLWDRSSTKSALLLHMMPATKESWEALADELYSAGFNVLALDFRGHGESGGIPYKEQTPEEVQKYFLDARSGLNFLEEKYGTGNIVLAGASIGANIALQCLAQDVTLSKAVVLSPGLDYYGVKASNFVQELKPEQEVFFVASGDDVRNKTDNNAAVQVEEIAKVGTYKKQKKIFKTGLHGTDMFTHHPDLIDEVVSFLSSK